MKSFVFNVWYGECCTKSFVWRVSYGGFCMEDAGSGSAGCQRKQRFRVSLGGNGLNGKGVEEAWMGPRQLHNSTDSKCDGIRVDMQVKTCGPDWPPMSIWLVSYDVIRDRVLAPSHGGALQHLIACDYQRALTSPPASAISWHPLLHTP